MKYKITLLIVTLFFFGIIEVEAANMFDIDGSQKTTMCMGTQQNSIFKEMEKVTMEDGVLKNLKPEYFVVVKKYIEVKTSNGTEYEEQIIYREPNYVQSTYSIEVDDGTGVENHTITSVVKDNSIPSSRTNGETTLDLSAFKAQSYVYFIYPTDELLASIPTNSVQYQNIVESQRPEEVKFCNLITDKTIDQNYTQVRPSVNITPAVEVQQNPVTYDFSIWLNEIYANLTELDKYSYSWSQNYWTTDTEVRNSEYDIESQTYITGETKIGDPLICEPTQVGLETKTYHKGEEFAIENNDYCKVNCVEQLTISYGEPIALLAGMGFTYDITIDSIVDCETEINEDKIKESFNSIDTTPCYMKPSCWGGIWGELGTPAAGPTEDFEQCIYECDGGLYSDQCSQICYDQVYNGIESTFGYQNKILVSPYLTNNSITNQLTPPFGVTIAADIKYGSAMNSCSEYKELYEWVKAVHEDINNEMGIEDGLDKLISSSGVFESYKNSYNYYCAYSPSVTNYSNYRFTDSFRKYDLDYINEYPYGSGLTFRAIARNCNSTCYWQGDCFKGVTRTEEDILKELSQLQDIVINSINDCSTVAANYEEKANSSYTSVITNKDIDDKPSDVNSGKTTLYSTYEEDNFPHSYQQETNGNGTIIMREALYRFPETYTNLDGEFVYPNKNGEYGLNPDTLKREYKETEHQFMTSFTSRTTNLDWYNWYFENVDDIEKIEKGEITNQLIYNGSNPDYNIETELRDVGIFDWAIDVDCYYALKSSVDDYDDTGDNKIVEGGLEYIFRPIDLANVFPNESGETQDDGTYDRVPQWNWTDDARFTTILEYEINPIALTKKIEQEDYSVYDEEPDYVITLDRNSISQIRSYNASQGSYLQYDNTECKPYDDGRTVCVSDFDYGTTDVVSRNASQIECNNFDGSGSCEIFGGTE